MRKIIVPVGYMGSGSSAVTDLISEFADVNNEYGSFEYVFLHSPNGVFDLEDKLLNGNNAIRSDEAIHSFLKNMKDLYDRKYWWVGGYKTKISPLFYQRTEEYIEELTDFKFQNYWYIQEKTNFRMFCQLILKKLVYILTLKKVVLKKPLLYDTMYISYPTPEKFYQVTKKYIYDVFNMIDSGNKDLLLDQLVLPFNLFRTPNYFDEDLKFIVVMRDPRDVFLLNKYVWTPVSKGVPFTLNVEDFCKQYKSLRSIEKPITSPNILRIYFEDLVFNYEETKAKIINFLGYQDREHLYPKKNFDPAISIKNTRLFENPQYQEEAAYIKKHLSEYLYDYQDGGQN